MLLSNVLKEIERIKAHRVQHLKRLACVYQRGAELQFEECIVGLSDLHVRVLHKGLKKQRDVLEPILRRAAATGHGESRRYAIFRAFISPSQPFDYTSVLRLAAQDDAIAAYLIGTQHSLSWLQPGDSGATMSDMEHVSLSFHWLGQACRLGSFDACFDLGLLSVMFGHTEIALKVLLHAVRGGFAPVLPCLKGSLLESGACLMLPSVEESLRFLRNAERLVFERGHGTVAMWLSETLLEGLWVPCDPVAATRARGRSFGGSWTDFSRPSLFGERDWGRSLTVIENITRRMIDDYASVRESFEFVVIPLSQAEGQMRRLQAGLYLPLVDG